jgi:small subunit ribosomal protein S16
MGRKKKPFYRIVAIDSRKRRDGAYLEKIGHYNPLTKPPEIVIDEEKALAWLLKGAQPSDTVRSFLSHKGLMLKYDQMKKGASEEKIAEELEKLRLVREEEAKKKEAAEKAAKKETPAEEIPAEEPVIEEAPKEKPTEAAAAKEQQPAEEEKKAEESEESAQKAE